MLVELFDFCENQRLIIIIAMKKRKYPNSVLIAYTFFSVTLKRANDVDVILSS